MLTKRETRLTPSATGHDPFTMLRQMTSEFDRIFGEAGWPSFGWPSLINRRVSEGATWFPEIDVFERENRLVTKVDLPGMTREDVKVEVTDGYLAISGERKAEAEEKKEHYYKCEREYGSFYRAVPLPEGVKLEDVKATFADGVLEVSVPLPTEAAPKTKRVEVQAAGHKEAKAAA